jgi:hypothetical protein
MSRDPVAQALADHLGVPVGEIEEGQPRRIAIDGGDLALEYRWLAELPALCLAVPLGSVLRATETDVLAYAMAANLYLADSGLPHFALCPQQETLYLCHSLSGDPPDAAQVGPTLDRLLLMARQARTDLGAQHWLA